MKNYPVSVQSDPVGDIETLLSLLSGVGSQVPAGLGGALTLLSTLDPAQAAETVGKISGDLTYTPRTEGGKETLLGVAEHPIMKGLEKAQTAMGDFGYEAGGELAARANPLYGVLGETSWKDKGSVVGGIFGELAPDLVDLVVGSHGAGVADNAMFAGVKAAKADLKALEKAKWEKAAGVMSEADIWKKHGWMQGKDGKWRFEIDDSNALLRRIDSQAIGHQLGGDRGVFSHPELYENYPGLKQAKVDFRTEPGGSYAAPEGMSMDEHGRVRNIRETLRAQHPNSAGEGETVNTLLHELQHAIQAREGFDIGENSRSYPEYKQPDLSSLDQLHDILGPYLVGLPEGTFQRMIEMHPVRMAKRAMGGWFEGVDLSNRDVTRMQRYIAEQTEPISPYENYLRNIGETEARNTETRRYLQPEVRRNSYPELTADRDRSITQPSRINNPGWIDDYPMQWVGQ